MAGTITTGGLASGIDTNSLIDKLVELQSRPITLAQKRQSGYRSQISILGDLVSKLSALETAAKALGTGGTLGLKVVGQNTAFSAAPGSTGAAGTTRIQVLELAQTAKIRSTALAAGEQVAPGTISLTVQGKDYTVNVGKRAGDPPVTAEDQPASLEDVAYALRTSGAPVSAVVLDNGAGRYLSVSPLQAGFPPGPPAGTALAISYAKTGTTGATLAFDPTPVQTAANARFTVDGLEFTRQSNTVSDALPGTTLTLKAKGGAAEDLVLEADPDATKAKLQSFVDAYNGVLRLVQRELAVTKDTDRSKTLSGDSTLRSLQGQLQGLVSGAALAGGNVRTLADLGLKSSGTDGSLSIDATALAAAIARDPAAVNAIFSTATTGITAVTTSLVQRHVRAGDGLLTVRKDNLDAAARRIDADLIRLQARVDAYREGLVRQFTAMEDAVGKLKSAGNFLSLQDAVYSKKS
jgi:flagellar hook-associated protein 2